ncbi:uncharacterized protein LOC121932565 [Sceloporus undulatus]|uniref:uncharacterized protein LOC121932565 n=1 Tax=Sceloporus undulatus TaxID=8520 RepID=UPI001C4A875D|nr:uncharacterized protein LOC121932565 [Sceloporus undulatus]XP_042327201.1 uncharacterized protein LOC121932565 [Sceloporus undulatus]
MTSVHVALLALFCVLPFTFCSYAIHYTSYGGICGDSCGYHGYDYTWCQQSGGSGKSWDYCSLEDGLDSSGQACASSCDLWGGNYRYCYLKNGKWNYCGMVGQTDFLEYSQENNLCIKNCRAIQGSFHCETIHGSQRCSPFQDITPTGLPCHNNYRCAKYGHSSYRCLIDDNKSMWDVCGQKGLDGCVWVTYESNSSQVEICTLSNTLKEGKVIFRREMRTNMLPPTKEEFKNAVHLIDKITSVTSHPDLGPQATTHFYKQEDIFCKGVNYTSVELHIRISEETAEPIAHVVYPAFLNSAHLLRLAFYTSLHSTFFPPAYTIAMSFDEPMLCSTDHQ